VTEDSRPVVATTEPASISTTTTKIDLSVAPATDCRCLRCSRVLRKPESIDRGMGWRRAKAVAA
jgi:hypothetical protein